MTLTLANIVFHDQWRAVTRFQQHIDRPIVLVARCELPMGENTSFVDVELSDVGELSRRGMIPAGRMNEAGFFIGRIIFVQVFRGGEGSSHHHRQKGPD